MKLNDVMTVANALSRLGDRAEVVGVCKDELEVFVDAKRYTLGVIGNLVNITWCVCEGGEQRTNMKRCTTSELPHELHSLR